MQNENQRNAFYLGCRQPFDFVSPTADETAFYNGQPWSRQEQTASPARFWEGPALSYMIGQGEPR